MATITVKRNQDESSDSMTRRFSKRIKKFNVVSRARKIKAYIKPLSHLEKKRKALRKAKYQDNLVIVERTGKTPRG
jgi:ribosomal protein S21